MIPPSLTVRPELVEGLSLSCHDSAPAHRVEGIELFIERLPNGRLWLRYHIDAPIDDLVLPDPAPRARADDLWQHLCCELFLRRPDGTEYLEWNFSPSSRWAGYRFSAYRTGREDIVVPAAPQILLDASDTHLALEVDVALPADWRDSPLLTGLSAVIEEAGGGKSYWALQHPPGPPDFHHPDCFALTLEAPGTA